MSVNIPLIILLYAQVTVWATEQEDPEKTIRKWTRISSLEATSSTLLDTTSLSNNTTMIDQQHNGSPQEDYFVPWHLPLHRAEAQGALNKNSQVGATSQLLEIPQNVCFTLYAPLLSAGG